MRTHLALAALLLAALARGEEPKKYHSGQLLQRESLQCTVFQNSDAKASDSTLCQEYVVAGEDVLFHLRAKDVKHPVLLPVGKAVGYRIQEDRFFLRVSTTDKKEHEYQVVSMERREKPEPLSQSAVKVNHLQ